MDQSGIRLNKFLAVHLGIGRREADNLVASGRVLVNDQKPIMGTRVRPTDKVKVNGKELSGSDSPNYVYLLMNKPTGYVCSKRQQGDTPTVYSLLPKEYQSLKTVGRLDKDSSGLIMLTNDGALAHQLTHPKFAKVKKYQVTLNASLQTNNLKAINAGVELEDGVSHLSIEPLDNPRSYLVTMREGRNRQIRRTFAAMGYAVTKLHRTQFGSFTLGNLKPGQISHTQLSS